MTLFLSNKYSKWYFNIISNAKNKNTYIESYTELHHIIPKSLGGTNHKTNLIRLTAKEHFVCHRLLTKMVDSNNRSKMVYALWMMIKGNKKQKRDFNIKSQTYSKIKENYALAVRNSKLGKKLSEETKLKISQSLKGSKKTKGKTAKWYEAHARTHKGKSNKERKIINTIMSQPT